jgi:hypothetical protein
MIDDANSALYNEISKFDKYNQEDYDQFEKFLINKPVAK